MRHYITTLFLTLFACSLFGQSNDTWTAFWNSDTTLFGFKDKNGLVKIEPKFSSFTVPSKFDNIIAAAEDFKDTYISYYLTKSGKIVGKDSLYLFDFGADCESEGFIRFRDSKTDKVGMFNRNGKIVIPAKFNELTRVRNGMIIGLYGAQKKFWDKDGGSGCNHFSWTGGNKILIDTNNNVLADRFNYDKSLDFFSLQKSLTPTTDPVRHNFLALDGQYYSFIDFEREFKQWLSLHLPDNFTKTHLLNATFKKVVYWKDPDGWINASKEAFIDANFELIKSILSELKSPTCHYNIFDEGLNQFMFDSEEYPEYYSNCDEAKDWIYPVKNIVISHENKNDFSQDHFSFLRTAEGYRLISVAVRNGELK